MHTVNSKQVSTSRLSLSQAITPRRRHNDRCRGYTEGQRGAVNYWTRPSANVVNLYSGRSSSTSHLK